MVKYIYIFIFNVILFYMDNNIILTPEHLKKTIIKIALLVIVTVMIIFFQKSNWLMFASMVVILFYIYFYLKVSLFFLIFVGFGGSFTESIVIFFTDLWKYKFPNLGNITCWLPLLWAIVGTGVIGLYDFSLIVTNYATQIKLY